MDKCIKEERCVFFTLKSYLDLLLCLKRYSGWPVNYFIFCSFLPIGLVLLLLLKYAITILLIITVGIQAFSKWIIVFSYEINKDYIAKNLCINRDKPASCCKGKCFLRKKLAADEDQQQPASKASIQKNLQPDLFLQNPIQINVSMEKMMIIHHPFYGCRKSQDFIKSIFEPPQFS